VLEALGEASPFVAMWRRVSFCIAAMREHLVSECWLPPFNSPQPSRSQRKEPQLERVRLYRRCAPFFRPMLSSMTRSWTLLLRLTGVPARGPSVRLPDQPAIQGSVSEHNHRLGTHVAKH
jgi:hypothetical protein